jgi:Nucleoside-diphosphate-sugar pyrophosphorylase involved in lipopolysaccharide biosynthesis/translation initiation factor 2B, gamma/epsilon subunits (eIF-2Bgamma/eIF-2Bepsilon)
LYALIIAGGEGERLRPLTDDRPKNMVPVAGRPIVDHQLDWLREGGVTDVVFLCRYKAEVLQAHVDDGSKFGVRAHYSIEPEPLGRGGALKLAFALVPAEELFVIACNGDILTDQPLGELIAFHQSKRAVATIMLAPLRSPYGIVDVADDGRIQSFVEKPVLPHWVNAGVYVLSREFFALLPEKGDHETTAFPAVTAQHKLFGLKSRAYWRPVDSIKDISGAEKELAGPTAK